MQSSAFATAMFLVNAILLELKTQNRGAMYRASNLNMPGL